ncbi:MAG: YdeI/OmpD-associated family protein [Chloroflexi bacterium]|nr:YdeI/OmpD-associated family protein [Chloroflexota bacterium]
MPPSDDAYQRVQPPTRTAWRQWLATNHAQVPGVWAVMWRQGVGRVGPSAEDLIDEALCVGWVESKRQKVDDERASIMCAPRKPRSAWSDAHKARVQRLIADRLMRPAGLEVIEQAKRDGTWGAVTRVDEADVPGDLARALARNITAQKHWDAFPAGVRKWFVSWVDGAKDPGTRMRRIEATVKQSKQNERPT